MKRQILTLAILFIAVVSSIYLISADSSVCTGNVNVFGYVCNSSMQSCFYVITATCSNVNTCVMPFSTINHCIRIGNYYVNASSTCSEDPITNIAPSAYAFTCWNVTNESSSANPSAIITSPADLAQFAVNYPVQFRQRSTYVNDVLKITWNFGQPVWNASAIPPTYPANAWYYIGNNIWAWTYGDGWIYPFKVFNDYSTYLDGSAADTTNTYTIPGAYTVLLTASEMTGTKQSSDSIRVAILGPGLTTIPVITSPENGSSEEEWVSFNASQSYVTNCSNYTYTCPSGKTCFTVGNLQCYYVHTPGKVSINTSSEHYDLMMNWTVKDGLGGVQMTKNGWWSTNYNGTTGAVIFDGHFPQVGTHYAKLNMTYYVR